jgi:hypothetical protein
MSLPARQISPCNTPNLFIRFDGRRRVLVAVNLALEKFANLARLFRQDIGRFALPTYENQLDGQLQPTA